MLSVFVSRIPLREDATQGKSRIAPARDKAHDKVFSASHITPTLHNSITPLPISNP